MDPNAIVSQMLDLRHDLATARHAGDHADVRVLQELIDEHHEALLAWRNRGGFAPRIGWRAALAL